MTVDLNGLSASGLRARRSMKWNVYPQDVIPLWVAEMDYPTAEPIMTALHAAVEAEVFGYPLGTRASGLGDAVSDWLAAQHGWSVAPADVHAVPDIMRGVSLALEAFSGPGEAVVLPTPLYHPFFDVVELSGRPQVHVPMTDQDGRWSMDLAGIERALAAGARTVVLCNPHNPLARVYSHAELSALAEVVTRHRARVISDEVHAPLVFEGSHLPYATLSTETAAHTVTLVSASKAWNLPGLRCAQVVTSNAADRATWNRIPPWSRVGVSTLGVEASIAAYGQGQGWLAEVLALLDEHRVMVTDAVAGMPGVRHRTNEATYLAWLDLGELELEVEPAQWFLEHARVALYAGPPFRAAPNRFARLNFATTTPILREALDRMASAVARR